MLLSVKMNLKVLLGEVSMAEQEKFYAKVRKLVEDGSYGFNLTVEILRSAKTDTTILELNVRKSTYVENLMEGVVTRGSLVLMAYEPEYGRFKVCDWVNPGEELVVERPVEKKEVSRSANVTSDINGLKLDQPLRG